MGYRAWEQQSERHIGTRETHTVLITGDGSFRNVLERACNRSDI